MLSPAKAIGPLVDEAVGNKPVNIKPGVKIRDQFKEAPIIPEGHTPVESSALKSYKYDSGAKELHVKYSSGDNVVHVFGDVSPEEAKAIETAPSKGKAVQAIKSGSHPLVAKIIGGERQAVKPAIPSN